MGEGADGDLVDAGFCHGANVLQSDAARGFESSAPADERDGRAELGKRHVVEEDGVDAHVKRLRYLLERVALHFDRKDSRGAKPRDGFGNRARGAEMVVLHEHAVVEPEAVIASASAHDRMLFGPAQTTGR